MGNYWSSYSQSRTTVILEPIVKKADTDALLDVVPSAPTEVGSVPKVMETMSPITSEHLEVYVKGEEPKKVHLEIGDVPKKVDLMIVKKEEELKDLHPKKEKPAELSTKLIQDLTKEVKDLIKELTPVEEPKKEESNDDNVLLLTSDELKERILGMTENFKKEDVKKNYKNTCTELLSKVPCYENPKMVDSDDEDVIPLSRKELKEHVMRELENTAKKVNIKMTEKTVYEYLKETSKEKIKSPSLEPVKEEILTEAHPYLLEYGTASIKTNTLLIDNHTYQKVNTITPVVKILDELVALEPVKPVVSVKPVEPVKSSPPKQQHNKNQKKHKRH